MRVKASSLAGTWYPAGREALRGLIDRYLAEASGEKPAQPVGLVVPHAGYRYSGQAAAYAYRLLDPSWCRRVVIVAPSHFVDFGGAALPPVDCFRTPLGDVEVDRPTVGKLSAEAGFRLDLAPFQEEHSLEIQLPFLQSVLEEFSLVPVVLGRLLQEEISSIAAALAPLADRETVLIASSDFVHYGARFGFVPFVAETPEGLRHALEDLDGGAISAILTGDPGAFLDYVARTGATICGRIPIAVLMATLGGGCRAHRLCYYTSGDVTGDWTSTVSYAAIAFERATEH